VSPGTAPRPSRREASSEPTGVGAAGFVDGAAHRAQLPPIYQRYQRADPRAGADAEARTALPRPLVATSFLLDAWLGEQDLFGVDAVVLSSASSKTSPGLGHLLRERGRGEVVCLTSRRHLDFVPRTGVVDRAVAPDDLPDALPDGSGVLPGPAPEMFFAPDHFQRLAARWGGSPSGSRHGRGPDRPGDRQCLLVVTRPVTGGRRARRSRARPPRSTRQGGCARGRPPRVR
jgi:hypothetical protein